MKLLLRRDQQTGGLMGNTTFSLTVRADLSDDERGNITKYKLGKCLLYSRGELTDPGAGLLGLAGRIAFKMMNLSITVDDLALGKRIDCKDIVEMLAVEEQIKDAARNFKAVLEASSTFGGEQLVEL